MNPFYQKSFLRLLDFSPAEIQQLLTLSAQLKKAKNQVKKLNILQEKISRLFSKKTQHVPVVPLKLRLLIKAPE